MILLDIVMPGIDGFVTLGQIHDDPQLNKIPVIFISALDSDLDEDRGFQLGAVDYIVKPFHPSIVLAHINIHLELKHAQDLLISQNQWLENEVRRRMKENLLIQDAIFNSLTELAETRDDNTGNHIYRTCRYIEVLAKILQKQPGYSETLSNDAIVRIVKAAPLHDIGKNGIPDAILLKKGPLEPNEYEEINQHTVIGARTLMHAIEKTLERNRDCESLSQNSALMFLKETEIIAKHHHERWDGTGYPDGLKGAEIPLSARLMALSDVFDALTTSRPYKAAWSFESAFDYIIKQKGTQFDPAVVEVFISEKCQFHKILDTISDEH